LGRLCSLLDEHGPLTGGELHARLGGDRFKLWRACQQGRGLRCQVLGKRYLRLDRRLPGLARLSPSILREFLTYSVVSLRGQERPAQRRAAEILDRIAEISSRKASLAKSAAEAVMAELRADGGALPSLAFILAGDIVYGMAHDEPRPERSTGRLVRGSDIDMVILAPDDAADEDLEAVDRAMHRIKFRILSDPALNQELDYVVKRLEKARWQTAFDTFKTMVACKIMQEGVLILGDAGLFNAMKRMLEESGAEARLEGLLRKAESERREAVKILSNQHVLEAGDPFRDLFYSSEESEEFE